MWSSAGLTARKRDVTAYERHIDQAMQCTSGIWSQRMSVKEVGTINGDGHGGSPDNQVSVEAGCDTTLAMRQSDQPRRIGAHGRGDSAE